MFFNVLSRNSLLSSSSLCLTEAMAETSQLALLDMQNVFASLEAAEDTEERMPGSEMHSLCLSSAVPELQLQAALC